ncbi:PIN domain-containing protein [Candidatus Bipolaricaulota bacterium]|nr:PIN domain-containing protein [Candidatus Bipolaricaulota bacterium]
MVPRRLYLDTSVYNRPFDDLSQPRVWLEALAFAVILQMLESGSVKLVNSEVLEFENSRNPFLHRKAWVSFYLSLATDYQESNESIRKRAEGLENQGLAPVDALHLACAEESKAEYFITCDDRIIKRYQREGLKVMNPVNFVISEVIDDDGDQGGQ